MLKLKTEPLLEPESIDDLIDTFLKVDDWTFRFYIRKTIELLDDKEYCERNELFYKEPFVDEYYENCFYKVLYTLIKYNYKVNENGQDL